MKLDKSCGGNCSSCLGLVALLVIIGVIVSMNSDDFSSYRQKKDTSKISRKKEPKQKVSLPKPIKNIVRLKGNTPAELRDLGFKFEMPEQANWEAGVNTKFQTTSWKEAYFHFNGKGILTSIDLWTKDPIDYKSAVKIMNQMGIEGEPNVNAPILWRWETPGVDLKTAYISKVEMGDSMVNRFYISFQIDWNQEKP